MVQQAEKAGYRNIDEIIEQGTALKAGDKVYANNMGKGLALYLIGEEPIEKGMRILKQAIKFMQIIWEKVLPFT